MEKQMTVTQLFEGLKEVHASVCDLAWAGQEDNVTRFIRQHELLEIEFLRMFPEFGRACGKFMPVESAEHIYKWLADGGHRGFFAVIEINRGTKISYIVYGETLENVLEQGLTWAKSRLQAAVGKSPS